MANLQNTILDDGVLCLASRMASAANYDAADSLLANANTGASLSLGVLLLRAKMLAQQHRWDEAISAFEGVLALQAGHHGAQEGVRLARLLKRRPRAWMHLISRLPALIMVFASSSVLLLLWIDHKSAHLADPVLTELKTAERREIDRDRESTAAISNVEQRIALVEQRLAAGDAERRKLSADSRRQFSRIIESLRKDMNLSHQP